MKSYTKNQNLGLRFLAFILSAALLPLVMYSNTWAAETAPTMVKNITEIGSTVFYGPVSVNGILYFSANDGINGEELWRSDGTEAGTVMIKDINSGSGSSYPTEITEMGDAFYFSASDETGNSELWKM